MKPAPAVAWQQTSTAVRGPDGTPTRPAPTAVGVRCHAAAVAGVTDAFHYCKAHPKQDNPLIGHPQLDYNGGNGLSHARETSLWPCA